MDACVDGDVMSRCALTSGDSIAFNLYVSPVGKPLVAVPIWRCCHVPELVELEEQRGAVATEAVAATDVSEEGRLGKRLLSESACQNDMQKSNAEVSSKRPRLPTITIDEL